MTQVVHRLDQERVNAFASKLAAPLPWLRLMRAENCVAAAAMTLVGAQLGHGDIARGLLAAACAGLLHGAGNVLNDRCDVGVDILARPRRPIPSGRISISSADALYLALTVAGIACAWMLGVAFAVAACGIALWSAAYCLWLKGTVLFGNISVAILAALTVPFGAAASAGAVNAATLLATALIGTYLLAFEILKCLQDRDTDAEFGIRTIGTVLQPRTCGLFAGCLLGAFAILTLIPFSWSGPAYRATLIAPLLCVAIAVFLVPTGQPHRVRTALGWLKAGWFAGLPALLLLT